VLEALSFAFVGSRSAGPKLYAHVLASLPPKALHMMSRTSVRPRPKCVVGLVIVVTIQSTRLSPEYIEFVINLRCSMTHLGRIVPMDDS
jgi:hypothetical protein